MEKLPTLWIQKYKIKNESGNPIEFDKRFFLWDIYNDLSPLQVLLKAPQIGATVMNTLKAFYVADKLKKDIIITLPTASDVNDVVGGKINRLIAQNPKLKLLVKDHDTVEQKKVGDSMIYWRGTFTNKQAMMVSSQLNIHDEVDASNQGVLVQYETRLQAEANGWRWYFSHPSLKNVGVDKYWEQSDKKMWFVKCEKCDTKQNLTWPESIDPEKEIYVCKNCGEELTDRVRGEWIATAKGEYSGYWISQLMCPWISAAKILKDFKEKDEQYFFNYVLGLPYVGGGNKLQEEDILGCVGGVNDQKGRIIIGVDTGLPIWYVCGNDQGIFYWGKCDDYEELDRLMRKWPQAIIVADQGGDLIGIRKLQATYNGRVFLCHYQSDRKTKELITWGKDYEYGNVKVDRNRMIQMMVDQFRDKRIVLNGTRNDWFDYWLHFNNLYREVEEDGLGVEKYVWKRSGGDHLAHATVYWLVGMDRFAKNDGGFIQPTTQFQQGAFIQDGKTQFFVPKPTNEQRFDV